MKDGEDMDHLIRSRPSPPPHLDNILPVRMVNSLPPLRLPVLPSTISYSIGDSMAETNRLLFCAHQGDYYELERLIIQQRDNIGLTGEESPEEEKKEEEMQTWTGAVDENGVCALLAACAEGFSECTRLLIEDGCADIDSVDTHRRTGLFLSAYNGRPGHERCAHELLVAGAHLYVSEASTGWTAMHAAAFSGNLSICKMILAAAEEDAEDADEEEEEPVEDPDAHPHPLRIADSEERLPLHIACLYGGGKEVVHAFMHRMIASPAGLPLHEALGKDESGFTPLHLAAMSGNVPAAVTLIQEMQVIEERAREGEGDNDHIDITAKFINLRDNRKRTALHLAAMAGRLDIVRSLLAAGAQISAVDENLMNPFHFAALNAQKRVIDEMLHHLRTADELCLPSAADGQGRTPLHAAAQSNRHKHSVDTVRALIEAGADIEAEDNMGFLPLMYACSAPVLEHADVESPNVPEELKGTNALCISFLISSGASVSSVDSCTRNAMHYACYSQDVQGVRAIIESLRSNPDEDEYDLDSLLNAQDDNGLSPLHYAVWKSTRNCGEVVRVLLQNGSSIDLADRHQRTPLAVACCRANKEATKTLLENGANALVIDESARTPLMLATLMHKKQLNDTADSSLAHIEAQRLQVVVEYLEFEGLEDKAALVSMADSKGRNVMHYAASLQHHSVSFAKYFQNQCHVDLFSPTLKGAYPFHIAASRGNVAFLDFCLTIGQDVYKKDGNGRSVVHLGALKGLSKVVDYALSRKWSLLDVDNKGCNALHLAIQHGRYDCALFLLTKAEEKEEEGGEKGEEKGRRWAAELVLAKDAAGRLPLHYYYLNPASNDDGEKIVAKLLDIMKKEGKATSTSDLTNNGWLHYACFAARPLDGLSLLKELCLCSAPPIFSLFEPNKFGITPLHALLGSPNYTVDSLSDLLQSCGHPPISSSLQDNFGRTPLHWATFYHRDLTTLEVLCGLKGSGNWVNLYDSKGYTPLLTAIRFADISVVKALLTGVSDKGDRILEAVADPSLPLKRSRGTGPLHLAAQTGNIEMFDLLLKCLLAQQPTQHPILTRDSRGWTVLHHAVHSAKKALVSHILTKLVDVASAEGQTALMLACTTKGYGGFGAAEEITTNLLACGADPFLKDVNGKLASDLAVHRRLVRVQRLLDEEMKKREEKEKGQASVSAEKGGEEGSAPKSRLRSWAAKSPFRYSVEDSKKIIEARYKKSHETEAEDIESRTPSPSPTPSSPSPSTAPTQSASPPVIELPILTPLSPPGLPALSSVSPLPALSVPSKALDSVEEIRILDDIRKNLSLVMEKMDIHQNSRIITQETLSTSLSHISEAITDLHTLHASFSRLEDQSHTIRDESKKNDEQLCSLLQGLIQNQPTKEDREKKTEKDTERHLSLSSSLLEVKESLPEYVRSLNIELNEIRQELRDVKGHLYEVNELLRNEQQQHAHTLALLNELRAQQSKPPAPSSSIEHDLLVKMMESIEDLRREVRAIPSHAPAPVASVPSHAAGSPTPAASTSLFDLPSSGSSSSPSSVQASSPVLDKPLFPSTPVNVDSSPIADPLSSRYSVSSSAPSSLNSFVEKEGGGGVAGKDLLFPMRTNQAKPPQSLSISQNELEPLDGEGPARVQVVRDGARIAFDYFLKLGRMIDPPPRTLSSRSISGETSSGFLRSTPPRQHPPSANSSSSSSVPRSSAPDLSSYYPNPSAHNPQLNRRPSQERKGTLFGF